MVNYAQLDDDKQAHPGLIGDSAYEVWRTMDR